jgi:hypothetical protein
MVRGCEERVQTGMKGVDLSRYVWRACRCLDRYQDEMPWVLSLFTECR